MIVCGVVAEYNPFHTGHAHQLSETRQILGPDTAIVAAISGNFVQRGDFALTDKYLRARAAVLGGVDLVVETPLAACLSSAEGFARGAVSLLAALGCTVLSFGCETPDAALLCRAAALLDECAFVPEKSVSFAAAKQNALERLDPQAARLLDHPNNTLAIEYCRAMRPFSMRPLAVERRGAAHDADVPAEGFASASLLRERMRAGNFVACVPFLPQGSTALLEAAITDGQAPATLPETTLLALLRRANANGKLNAGARDGFDQRIRTAVHGAVSFSDAVRRAATRRFPTARVRRALLRAVLDIAPNELALPGYVRVLALNARGRAVLRAAQSGLPVLSKPVAEKRMPAALQPALARDWFADDLFSLALPAARFFAAGASFLQTPFYLSEDDT